VSEREFDMNQLLRDNYPGQGTTKSKNNEDLDKLISGVFPKKYRRKMARIIGDVCCQSGVAYSADEVAERLVELVRSGKYAGYGNLDRWGFAEIGPIKLTDT